MLKVVRAQSCVCVCVYLRHPSLLWSRRHTSAHIVRRPVPRPTTFVVALRRQMSLLGGQLHLRSPDVATRRPVAIALTRCRRGWDAKSRSARLGSGAKSMVMVIIFVSFVSSYLRRPPPAQHSLLAQGFPSPSSFPRRLSTKSRLPKESERERKGKISKS